MIYYLLSFIFRLLYFSYLFIFLKTSINDEFEKRMIFPIVMLDALIEVLFNFFGLNSLLFGLLEFLICEVSVIVLFIPEKKSKFLILNLCLVSYLCLMSGLQFFFKKLYFNIIDKTTINIVLYYIFYPLIAILITLILITLAKFFYKKRLKDEYVFNVEIVYNNNKNNFRLFLDSGNSLYDNITMMPIILIDENIFKKKFKEVKISHIAKCKTVSGILNLPIVKNVKVFIDSNNSKKRVKCVVGLIEHRFNSYDGLLHFEMSGGMYVG